MKNKIGYIGIYHSIEDLNKAKEGILEEGVDNIFISSNDYKDLSQFENMVNYIKEQKQKGITPSVVFYDEKSIVYTNQDFLYILKTLNDLGVKMKLIKEDIVPLNNILKEDLDKFIVYFDKINEFHKNAISYHTRTTKRKKYKRKMSDSEILKEMKRIKEKKTTVDEVCLKYDITKNTWRNYMEDFEK